MASNIVAGELYETLTGQLFELGRQLRQPNGYPFNPHQLKLHLQAAIEGRFAPGEAYRIKLGGPETTDQITAALGFPFSDLITQANFPLAGEDRDIEIEIIDPNSPFSEEDGLRFLAEAKLERPTHQQALRFAFEHGRTTSSTKKPFVVFLHEAWQDPSRDRRVLYLDRGPSDRGLGLLYPDKQVRRLLRACRGPASQAALGRLTPSDFRSLCPFACWKPTASNRRRIFSVCSAFGDFVFYDGCSRGP